MASDNKVPVQNSLNVRYDANRKGFYATANITDNLSGVSNASLSLKSPNGKVHLSIQLTYNSSLGLYDGFTSVGQYAESGTWKINNL